MFTRAFLGAAWSRVLVGFLISIIIVEPALLQATELPSEQPAASELHRVEDEFDNFEKADANEGPAALKDTFRLVEQRLELWDSSTKTYRSRYLRELKVGEPAVMADFLNLSNLRAEILPGRKEFALVKEKRNSSAEKPAVARHVFQLAPEDGEAIDIQFDREFLYVITSTGKIFSLYMPLARSGSFQQVLPLVYLFSLPSSMLEKPEQLKLKFALRSHRPVDSFKLHSDAIFPRDRLSEDTDMTEPLSALPENYPFTASDLLILRNQGSDTEILGILDAHVTLARVHLGLAVAAQLSATASGIAISPEISQVEAVKTEWSFVMSDPIVTQAFVNLGSQYSKLVGAEAQAENQLQNKPVRDRFTPAEWRETYSELEKQARAQLSENGSSKQQNELHSALEKAELDAYTREYLETPEQDTRGPLWRRLLGKKSMNRLGMTLAVGGGALLGGSHVVEGDALVWALHLSQQIYEWLPEPITTTPYNFYLLTSVSFLSLGVPILWTIGQVTKTLLGGERRGYDFKRGLGWLATVQYARLVKMFYITATESVFRNPTFFSMLKKSMNPFRRISAKSELGQRLGLRKNIWPGLNIPGFGSEWQEKIDEKREIIGKIYEDKLNAKAIALLLAVFLVSEEEQMDPASVYLAMTEGRIPSLEDETQKKRWEEAAAMMSEVFEGVASAKGFKSLAEMNPEEFESIYQQGREIVQDLKALEKSNPGFIRQRQRWRRSRQLVTQRAIPFVASWGVEQSEVLKNSPISQPIANESWRSTWIDFYFTTFQQAIVGGRADFSQPEMLYASPQGSWWLGKANPANVSDTVEQLAIHGISVPSRNVIDFQTSTVLEETRYAPLEDLTLQRTVRHQKLGEAMKAWAGGVFNLEQISKFGGILWRSMYANRFKMIQSGVLFSVVPRVALAGQSISEAFAAWSFVWFLAPFFAFVWPFAVVGNTKLETGTAEQYKALKEAQALLNQGLRLHNKDLLKEGMEKVSRFYSSLPPEAQEAVKQAEELLKEENFEVKNWMIFENHREAVLDLWEALELQKLERGEAKETPQTAARVKAAAEKIKEQYSADEAKALSPAELLQLSLEKPAFATSHHKWLQNMATFFVGVIPSTYIASFLFAHSYREDMNWAVAIPVAAAAGVGSFYTVKLVLDKAVKPITRLTKAASSFMTTPFRKNLSSEEKAQKQRNELAAQIESKAKKIGLKAPSAPVDDAEKTGPTNWTNSPLNPGSCRDSLSNLSQNREWPPLD